jgi:hypothetical protein
VLATLKQRSTIAALIVAAITAGLLCLSPLLGAPGIESALVLGILLPPFCAAIGARVVDRARKAEGEVRAANVLADSIFGALVVFALPALVLVLDTLRVPICDASEGILFLALGPGIGVVLAAITGVLSALLVPRTRWATALAVLVPIGAMGVELALFYATPAIYAYAHFVGYFPGTLYDPDITVTDVYATHRVVTVVWILGLSALFGWLWSPSTKRPSVKVALSRWRLGLGALGGVALGVIACVYGPELRHRSSAGSIAEALGGRLRSERCLVIFPREMPRRDAVRLGQDCDFRVTQAERSIGVRQPRRVTAFFFRSADEKRVLMGASSTYIAKPWRDEVYLQVSDWPHGVLFHEIVHVVVGNTGRGPFRISGGLFGIIPSPGIIEGVAVAVAWEESGGLTPHQWARAMLDEELAPPLSSVDGLSFLLQPASRAYTASGSFVRWIYETEGPGAIRRLYATGDFEEALNRPLDAAERDWHAFLRNEVELPDEARALAQLRFTQPGIFGQICPHRVANLEEELALDLAAGDDRAAARTCRSILALDDGQASTRAVLVGALARRGETRPAERELRSLIGPPAAAPPLVASARRELADAYWMRGDRDRALAIYRELASEPMTDEEKRQIEVRLLAIEMGGEGERALRGLLAPRRDRTNDPAIAMAHIESLSRARTDGLAAYLEARQLMMRQRFELALPRIVRAQELGLPTDLVRREARRMEAVSRFANGELDASAAIWRTIARDPTRGEGERVEARDWLTRIRLAR